MRVLTNGCTVLDNDTGEIVLQTAEASAASLSWGSGPRPRGCRGGVGDRRSPPTEQAVKTKNDCHA